ncbi:MAG: PH domain-containing protein [Ruminococcaceae bacterium]|nr:PH domain-containing protein [Oscillospiraceae bacterium]
MAKPNNVITKERKRWGFLGLPFTFTVYSITDKKLLIKKGFLNRSYDEILLYRVTDLQLKNTFSQTLFGLGLGTVTVYSKDTSDGTLEIKNIRHAKNFYDTLSDNLEKERLRYGVRASELIGHEGGSMDGHDFDTVDGAF